MTNSRFYKISNGCTAEALVEHMENFLRDTENMETQRIETPSQGIVVLQARVRGGKVKQLVGMDRAITLRFFESNSDIHVEIGEAKWTDKAVVMTTSMFVLWPLAVTSGVGIYKQKSLANSILRELDTYMPGVPEASEKSSIGKAFEAAGKKIDEISRSNAMQHLAAEAPKILAKMIR